MALIDTIAQFLCRQHTSDCLSSVQQQSPDPLVQIMFLVFFPSVFLILFIYILSGSVTHKEGKGHNGIRLLIGIAVYLFIVFYDWYHFALILSKFWFISIIVLGGLYVFINKMGVRGGDSGSGSGKSLFGGLPGYAAKKMIKGKTGSEKRIEAGIRELRGIVNDIKHPEHRGRGTNIGTLRAMYATKKEAVATAIGNFEHEVGLVAEETPIVKKFWDEITKLDKEAAKA